MYIYHKLISISPKEDLYMAFTSLRAITETTGIPYDTLTYHFSRNNATRYARDGAVITKVKPITSKRKSINEIGILK